jgi:two-component system LytT family response regulator
MLSALIVDDEELARRGLEIRLAEYDDIRICGQARNGREAIAAVREHSPDLIFLDVQMPGMDGFEVLRRLSGSCMPEVIFVTAYDEFALKAFDANALDYLLKPLNDDRLREAIERARKNSDEKHADEQRNKLLKFVCELTGRELTLDSALAAATCERRHLRNARHDETPGRPPGPGDICARPSFGDR